MPLQSWHCLQSLSPKRPFPSDFKAHTQQCLFSMSSYPWPMSAICGNGTGFKSGSCSHLLPSRMARLTGRECSLRKEIWDRKSHPPRAGIGQTPEPRKRSCAGKSLLRISPEAGVYCPDLNILLTSGKQKPSSRLISRSSPVRPSACDKTSFLMPTHIQERLN